MDAPHPNYDHIHQARTGQLPHAVRTGSHQVTRGYAVGMSGRLPQAWVFFDHLVRDVSFLHVDLNADLRDHQSGRPILERWLRGTHPGSAYFQLPDDPGLVTSAPTTISSPRSGRQSHASGLASIGALNARRRC